MRYFIFLFILFTACNKRCYKTDNLDLFDEFWEVFDHEYASFEILDIDWDAVYAEYRPRINDSSSDEETFQVFKEMIYELQDAHSDLKTHSDLGKISYFSEVADKHPFNYIGWDNLKEEYLTDLQEYSRLIASASIRDHTDIGYIRIQSFSQEESLYDVLDLLLENKPNLKGIIIDIRNNSGGNEVYGRKIAARCMDKKVIYRYARVKKGCDRNKLSDFIPLELVPSDKPFYEGKVVVLTNKRTFSAGEDFALMMKECPNAVVLGDNTWGGFATGPDTKNLSNGWTYRVSKKISYNLNKDPIVVGVVPDEKLDITPAEIEQNKDAILERAISIINE